MTKSDATRNLPPGSPTQTTPKGLKIGIPGRAGFLGLLKKAAKKR